MPEYLEIPFPFGGLAESTAHGDQPLLTCRDELNVRGYDPTSDRNRGSSRAGISAYDSDAVNGANPVTCMSHLVIPTRSITYSAASPPVEEWTETTNTDGVYAMVRDAYGDLLCVGRSMLTKFNQSGGITYQRGIEVPPLDESLPGSAGPAVVSGIAVGHDDLTVYVSFRWQGKRKGGLYKYAVIDGFVTTVWKVEFPDDGESCNGVAFSNGAVYSTWYDGEGNTRLRKHIDQGSTAVLAWSKQRYGTEFRGLCVTDAGQIYVAFARTAQVPEASGGITKFNSDGEWAWGADYYDDLNGTPPSQRADYHAVATYTDTSGVRWVYGHGTQVTGLKLRVAHVQDDGASWNIANSGLITSTNPIYLGPNQTNNHDMGSIVCDEDGRAYVRSYKIETGTRTDYLIRVQFSGTTGSFNWAYALDFYGRAVACDFRKPPQSTVSVQFIYAAGIGSTQGGTDIEKVTQLTRTLSDTTQRSTRLIAVCNGAVRHLLSGTYTAPTNPDSLSLNTTTKYVRAVVNGLRVYFIDGKTEIYLEHDPVAATMTLYPWRATSGGILPQNCRHFVAWRNRPVLSGNPDEPQNWYMGAMGDFHNFEYFPPQTLATQAVAGNNSEAGLCPDIINTVIPISDDLLAFGCDHTIYRLTGDPMEGGRFDLVSDITGVAWGETWAKDPEGVVYFYGSRGGVYRWPPGGMPESITDTKIGKRLRDVNLDTNKVMLVWNDRDQALHVFITPYSAATTTHYVWERRNNAWHPDRFASTNFDPLSVHVMDGDAPSDRVMLLGGRNGIIRKWDHAEDQDHGSSFSSYVVAGPFMPSGRAGDAKLCELAAVLTSTSGSVSYEVYATDDPSTLGTAAFTSATTGAWVAGRNHSIRQRARAEAFFIKYGNGVVGSPADSAWGLESLTAGFLPGGRIRKGA